jgi:hypothetical protein
MHGATAAVSALLFKEKKKKGPDQNCQLQGHWRHTISFPSALETSTTVKKE